MSGPEICELAIKNDDKKVTDNNKIKIMEVEWVHSQLLFHWHY